MPRVRIPAPLRQHADGQREVAVAGATLGEVLRALTERWPGLRPRLLDGDGGLHPFVSVFVDGEDVRLLQGLQTPLRADAEVTILPSMAGGAERA